MSQDEFGNVIIPCRPTSLEVNVTLYKDDEEVSYYISQIYSINKNGGCLIMIQFNSIITLNVGAQE